MIRAIAIAILLTLPGAALAKPRAAFTKADLFAALVCLDMYGSHGCKAPPPHNHRKKHQR